MAKRKGPVRDVDLARRWRGLVSQWRKSGLGVRAFCRKSKVRESGFYYWRRALSRRGGPRKKVQAAAPVRSTASNLFVPVTLRPSGGMLEVSLPGDIVVRAPVGTPAEEIGKLVAVVKSC